MSMFRRDDPDARQRLAAFAFAAADLLVETDPDGAIRFALGAARAHFGCDAAALIDQSFAQLLAPAERYAVPSLLALLAGAGRLQPHLVWLADGQPMALGGMILPDRQHRFCLTLSELPAGLVPQNRPVLTDDKALMAAASDRVRLPTGAGKARVALVETRGLGAITEALPETERARLSAELAASITEVAPGGLPGKLTEDRFAVLHDGGADPHAIGRAITQTVQRMTGTRGLQHTAGLDYALEGENLTRGQVIRALGVALGRFGRGGTRALDQAGLRNSLAGYVARVQEEAEAVQAMLREGAFAMAFQPVVRLSDQSIHHYEALLRPMGRRGGLGATTGEMVAAAEEADITDALDIAVIERVLAALADAPLEAQAAVNISPLSIAKPQFGRALLERLDMAPALLRRLLVEVTETAELRVDGASQALLLGLRERGVRLCLDDFGAGAAGFAALREIAFEFVKIDGGYVRRIDHSQRDRSLVQAIALYCRQSGAIAVAEQVETEAQTATLVELGVPLAQGYLFGRPGARLR
ncbi:MAG: EAL domain-containing protein [Alphaproteobacteria bacterium]|nr:EAL domain-containing protein [Alphaproteobacteria bacterium]